MCLYQQVWRARQGAQKIPNCGAARGERCA